MSHNYTRYFDQLLERAGSAAPVPFRRVTAQGWQPAPNDCHRNVEVWAEKHFGAKVVRGWLFWPPNEADQYIFMAHSVVEEDGQLYDITPIDSATPRDTLLFLRHLGTEEAFRPMEVACAQVFYPLIAIAAISADGFDEFEIGYDDVNEYPGGIRSPWNPSGT